MLITCNIAFLIESEEAFSTPMFFEPSINVFVPSILEINAFFISGTCLEITSRNFLPTKSGSVNKISEFVSESFFKKSIFFLLTLKNHLIQ